MVNGASCLVSPKVLAGRDVTVVDVAGAMSAALLAATAAAPRLQLGGKGKLDPAPLHVSSCDH